MAEYADEMEDLVPLEIGLQANETILMWGGAILFWLLSLVFMGFAVDWKVSFLGFFSYFFGLVALLASQFVSRYNPIRTTRIPITGIITWVWAVFLSGFVLWKGWSVYLGSSVFIFILVYAVIALLITGLLIGANFLTSLKILNWMSMDMPAFLFALGAITMLIGITHTGFNNTALLDIETLTLVDWTLLFLFSMSFVFMLELFHGAHRFNDIINYAKNMSSGEFSLTPVINNYYIMGSILMLIVAGNVLAFLCIYYFWYWILKVFFQRLGDSLMVNSVYSLVFLMCALFIPMWVVLILWMEYKNRREAAEEEEMRRNREKTEKLGVY